MAKVKNRRDNHEIKRPKSSSGYTSREERERQAEKRRERTIKDGSFKTSKPKTYDRPKEKTRDFSPEHENRNLLIGRNPVTEALKAGREVEKIMVSQREGSIIKILGLAKDKGIPVMYVERTALDRISGGKAHQGIIAFVSEYRYSNIEDIFALAKKREEDPFIIVLDGIEDPHNLGAILRSAECSGAHGVIIPKRNAVGLTEVVAKTSAGAIEYVPVVKVTNIAATLEELKERNVWTVCLDMDGRNYTEISMDKGIALVVGSEGFGVSRLVKEKCDFVASLPLKGKITSLNASNAGAVMMYEVRRQRDL